LAACGPGGPVVGGARSFAEIDVAAATRSLAEEAARLVQVRDSQSPDPHLEHAAIVGPEEAVPDAWLHEARPIVVIAHDEVAARRLAARLLRLGASRVSVVRGGIEAWSGPPEDRAPSDDDRVGLSSPRGAKPTRREPARRTDPWQQSQK
jgi:rhodanese-related sulfurtransferase